MNFEKTITIHVDIEYVADMLANCLEDIFLENCGFEHEELNAIDENKVLLAVADYWTKNLY